MKKSIFDIVTIAIVGLIVVCLSMMKNSSSEQAISDIRPLDSIRYVPEDDLDRLAFWFREHDSINHDFVLIAEHLWREPIVINGDNRERNKWYREGEAALIHGFDSRYPHSTFPDDIKAELMLSGIEAFFEQDADYSTMGMIINFDLQCSFLTYRMVAESSRILKVNPAFSIELEAWDFFSEVMSRFCLGVASLEWFGASGHGPAVGAMEKLILQSRVDDLRNIYKLYLEDSPELAVNVNLSIESQLARAKSKFVSAVESVASSVDSEFSLPGDPRQDYKTLYHETQEAKSPLIKMLDKWVKTREKLIRAETNTKRKDALLEKTIAAIASLTECVLNTKAERTCVD